MPKKSKNEQYVKPEFYSHANRINDSPSTNTRSTRSHRGSSGEITSLVELYPYVNDLPLPFQKRNISGNTYVTPREMLQLIEKAYFGFSLYRNVVETQVELANTDITLTGGNKQARNFIYKWLNRINIWSIGDQWFRDYFWKANVYPYRIDASFTEDNIKQLQTIYGIEQVKAAKKEKKSLPIDYLFLPPEDIISEESSSYTNGFYKLLSPNDINRIKYPKTQEDKEFAASFDTENLNNIINKSFTYQKIDPSKVYYSSYKRQKYYAFGVPFGYSVLSDINYKLLLNKLDEELAKTLDLALLHIKVGDTNGKVPINQNNITILQSLFSNPKMQRVLVTDCFVDIDWKVPDINDLLGAGKHEEINRRLKEGLFASIFGEGDKFASLSVKARVFIEKLNEARKAFINDFLQAEVKRVCEIMGFKVYPKVTFTDISLEDEVTLRRIYARLAELGFLTPQETFKAIKDGVLPEEDEAIENQKTFKSQKDSGLYQPLLNKPQDNAANGRPSGSGSPQTTKKTKPIGTKAISVTKIIDYTNKIEELKNSVRSTLLAKLKTDKLTEKEESLAKKLSFTIAANENINEWAAKAEQYIKKPITIKPEIQIQITDIETKLDVSSDEAIILYLSQNEN